MNVLQIVPELRSGGVERGTVDFAKYLAENGHRSVVVSNGGSLVGEMVAAGVMHYKLPVHKKSFFSVLSEARTLEKILRSESIDIVHARSRVPAWIAFIACRRAGIPMITTCHGIYGTHALSRVMGWGRTVISISTAVTRHMTQHFKVPYKRIRMVHRGVNLTEFSDLKTEACNEKSRKDEEFIIGIVGRITPIKGHPVLIRAMARVARVYPQAKLWIVGDAPKHRYGEELRHLVSKLNLAENVEFLGTQRDIPSLLARMDVLVAPAVGEEAFGRVMIEAGALGVPVIASRIGGIVDVIRHGKDGILTTAGDVTMLAEAILGVFREPQLAKKLADSLRIRVREKFDDRIMFEKTMQVYNEALRSKRILIAKFGAVGDAVLISPSIREIRRKYPEAHIAVLCDRSCREIFSRNKHINDVITFDRAEIYSGIKLFTLIKVLSREAFDVYLDFHNNRLSHFLAYFS
ncbi:MAG: glycosyltransferase, partial [Candidatus Omnitrophica bacterium]|nr:glycosyltransferase [Candidatus Omnitrophota bacterium]